MRPEEFQRLLQPVLNGGFQPAENVNFYLNDNPLKIILKAETVLFLNDFPSLSVPVWLFFSTV